jgi:hypothetical protein
MPEDVGGGKNVQYRLHEEQITEERSVIEHTLSLQANRPEAVNKTALRQSLAEMYGLPIAAITLTLSNAELALKEWEDAIEQEKSEEGERRQLDTLPREHLLTPGESRAGSAHPGETKPRRLATYSAHFVVHIDPS